MLKLQSYINLQRSQATECFYERNCHCEGGSASFPRVLSMAKLNIKLRPCGKNMIPYGVIGGCLILDEKLLCVALI